MTITSHHQSCVYPPQIHSQQPVSESLAIPPQIFSLYLTLLRSKGAVAARSPGPVTTTAGRRAAHTRCTGLTLPPPLTLTLERSNGAVAARSPGPVTTTAGRRGWS